MNEYLRKRLVFHAGAVVVLGMLSGIPLAMALLQVIEGDPSDWSVSHMEGLINGLLMLAIAGAGSLMLLSPRQQQWLYWSIVFTGYSNALYGWARGFSGQAGMDFAPPIGNQLAALLGGLPITTAFIAISLIMIGSWKAAKTHNP